MTTTTTIHIPDQAALGARARMLTIETGEQSYVLEFYIVDKSNPSGTHEVEMYATRKETLTKLVSTMNTALEKL